MCEIWFPLTFTWVTNCMINSSRPKCSGKVWACPSPWMGNVQHSKLSFFSSAVIPCCRMLCVLHSIVKYWCFLSYTCGHSADGIVSFLCWLFWLKLLYISALPIISCLQSVEVAKCIRILFLCYSIVVYPVSHSWHHIAVSAVQWSLQQCDIDT